MKAYYDIHIHSVLSACASEIQTPNNILNMCMLKGLNIVSITDHNSLKQMETIDKIVPSYDFLFLYGVEVTVKEGFHVLAYFENLKQALTFDTIIEKANPKIPFHNHYGRQVLCDEFDEEIGEIDYQLNVPLSIDLAKMITEVHTLGGVVILAHIDRSNGILEYYSDFSNYNIDGIEVREKEKIASLLIQHPYLNNYQILYSSDAHSLENIHERDFFLELENLNFECFKRALKK